MSLFLNIPTPSSGYTTEIDVIVNNTYSLSLAVLKELCDVVNAEEQIGRGATDAQVGEYLAGMGTWSTMSSGVRTSTVTSRRATLATLRA